MNDFALFSQKWLSIIDHFWEHKNKKMCKKKYCLVYVATFFALLFFASLEAVQFVSLKSSQVNVRVGPGKEYPVSWTFMWANIPMLLIAEFNEWCKVKFFDGTEGWVHKNMISRKNTVIVIDEYAIMYKYSSKSHPIAKIEKNVVCRVLKKEEHWIKVEVGGIKGWIEAKQIWGIDSGTVDARNFIN
ncbi:MAG: hypothetical protein LBB12_01230 [Holosporaceae bacterium]|jgi:SH3-like domain-containing protein|nr:hypothetical protein [Holosporaceae bacterium]